MPSKAKPSRRKSLIHKIYTFLCLATMDFVMKFSGILC